jgi:hypothetical protein
MKRYRIAFMERTDEAGNPTEKPAADVQLDLLEGVVEEALFIERTEPESLHGEESLDEDDSFESIGTEVWEYAIADGREREFLDAVKNSRVAIDVQEIDSA